MLNYNSEIFINQRRISIDSPVYFIADIGANHDGDIERAKELIWLAAESGADAVKFQHFSADSIVSDFGFNALENKFSHQSKWEKPVYETYKDASLNMSWTEILLKKCNEAKTDFFTSPYSLQIVDEVNHFVPAYKIGSGDITFTEIISHIARKQKPVLLATGASTFSDVERAVDAILQHNPNIVLMQCNTNYTGDVENFRYINLKVIETYKRKYPQMILGLSDHTIGDSTVLASIALGARVIEKHFTDDNKRKGPDHFFAMTPSSWKIMVERSREVEASLGSGIKEVEENEKETVILQRRCMCTTRSLPANHVLREEDLIALRPAPPINSYEPYRKSEIVGAILVKPKIKGDAIFKDDIKL